MAARNELVKELRRDKDKESATAVAAMRRPAWSDWALNVTSFDEPDDIAAFVDAAAAVREAQAAAIEGRDGPDVRESLRHLRDQTAVLVEHGNRALAAHGRTDDTAELTARLAEVAGNPAAVDQLRQGRLGSGDLGRTDLFAGLEPAPTAARRPPAKAEPRRASGPAGRAAPSRRPAQPQITAAERRGLQRDVDAAERRYQKARKALAEAESAAGLAERALAAAQARVDDARTRLAAATDELQREEAARDNAEAALAAATPTAASAS